MNLPLVRRTSWPGGRIPLSDHLGQILEDFQQQGELDSSGCFTLDPRRAREMLRKFQLQDPQDYVLCLISFLVGLGSSKIGLQTQGGDFFHLVGGGVCLPTEVVANPLGALFSGQTGSAYRELAIGLNAALGIPGTKITLHSSDTDQGFIGVYEAEVFQCKPCKGGEHRQLKISVDTSKAPRPLPVETVKHAFRYCPVELAVNDLRLSQRIVMEPETACVRLRPQQVGPAWALDVGSVAEVYEHPGPVQAVIAFGSQTDACHWLYSGRCYERPLPWRLEHSGLKIEMWIACDRVDKDLSQSELVENDRYQKVVLFLKQVLGRALDDLLERAVGQQLQPRQLERLHPLLVYGVEAAARRGEFKLAWQLQKIVAAGGKELDQYRLRLLEERQSGQSSGYDRLEASNDLGVLWPVARANLAVRGPHHPQAREILMNCAHRAHSEGEYEVALNCWTPCLGPQNNDHGLSLLLGRCLLELGRAEEARHTLRLSLQRSLHDPVEIRELLALAEAQLGNVREAATLLAEVLRSKQARHGDRSPELGVTLQRLALLCHQLDEEKTAAHYESWARTLA